MIISTQRDRQKIISGFGAAAGLGWMVFEFFVQLLLGPHISMERAIAIGSGVGAGIGLLLGISQWLLLRRYTPYAGWWIPATTAGCTLGGTLGGYLLRHGMVHAQIIPPAPPLEGIIASSIVGLTIASCQWLVLRHWVQRAWAFMLFMMVGLAFAEPVAWLVGNGTIAVLSSLIGSWPFVLIGGFIGGGVAGGLALALGISWALQQVLPEPLQLEELSTQDLQPGGAPVSSPAP